MVIFAWSQIRIAVSYIRVIESRIPLTTNPNQPCFTLPQVWDGGYYELDLYFGASSEDNMLAAVRALWQPPDLEGPYGVRDKEPADQPLVHDVAEFDALFGIARFRGVRVPCGMFGIGHENDDGRRVPGDHLSLSFPLGALSLVFPVGAYPFADWDAAASWRAEVDAWFVQLLEARRQAFTFEIGLIGFELDAPAPDLVQGFKAGTMPSNRIDGVVVNQEGSLKWYPPTRHDLIHTRPA